MLPVVILCSKGAFWCLTNSPIPFMQFCAGVRDTYRKQQTPQLWMEGRGRGVDSFVLWSYPTWEPMPIEDERRLWLELQGHMENIRPFPASPPLPKRSFFFSSLLFPNTLDLRPILRSKLFKICKTNCLLTIVFVNAVWISSCNKITCKSPVT